MVSSFPIIPILYLQQPEEFLNNPLIDWHSSQFFFTCLSYFVAGLILVSRSIAMATSASGTDTPQ